MSKRNRVHLSCPSGVGPLRKRGSQLFVLTFRTTPKHLLVQKAPSAKNGCFCVSGTHTGFTVEKLGVWL